MGRGGGGIGYQAMGEISPSACGDKICVAAFVLWSPDGGVIFLLKDR